MPPFRTEREKSRFFHNALEKSAIFNLEFLKEAIFQSIRFALFPGAAFKGIKVRPHVESVPFFIGNRQIESVSEVVHTTALGIRDKVAKRGSRYGLP